MQASTIERYEPICHVVRRDNFLLALRKPPHEIPRKSLPAERLERAIGVTYRPVAERLPHTFLLGL